MYNAFFLIHFQWIILLLLYWYLFDENQLYLSGKYQYEHIFPPVYCFDLSGEYKYSVCFFLFLFLNKYFSFNVTMHCLGYEILREWKWFIDLSISDLFRANILWMSITMVNDTRRIEKMVVKINCRVDEKIDITK